MARAARRSSVELVWDAVRYGWAQPWSARFRGGVICVIGAGLLLSVATYNAADPSLNAATGQPATNALGSAGAALADMVMQSMGLSGWVAAALMLVFGLSRVTQPDPAAHRRDLRVRALVGGLGLLALAGLLAAPPRPAAWPLAKGLGGFWGDGVLNLLAGLLGFAHLPGASLIAALLLAIGAVVALGYAIGVRRINPEAIGDMIHDLM
ncbi:DNA translocase FtsK 4TM domain-containing protein, partial [Caulobacter sp.]|uniref:DNA translocase FtsK 4TM domain-containing protein n=1 Tax=Caulobacter sp. TaxID=78 RepID=UPI003BAE9ED0